MSGTGEKAAFKPTPVFRRARSDEAAALTEIALAAKQSWGYPDEWLAAWRADLTLTADYIRAQPVVVAELDGTIAGFFGLERKDGDWHLEHLWLRPVFIGRGLGRELFAAAVRLARAGGAAELRIRSDPNAEPFYLKMGAVRAGQEAYLLLGKIPREVPLLVYPLRCSENYARF
jgi:GNAT superfamily N-acetyltransferase